VNKLLHSLPRLVFVALLWVIGGPLVVVNGSLLIEVYRGEREIFANIENRVPPNPLDPDGWEGRLQHINQVKSLVFLWLAGSVLIVVAGFVLLYWPSVPVSFSMFADSQKDATLPARASINSQQP
jgi:hypothetical protein